nr:hypothetical protein [Lachnospiraceae bacterium]
NIGSTLFQMQDNFGEDYWMRANHAGLDMAALHNVIPSATAGQVPLATAKRTSIDVNDPALNAYIAAYDKVAIPTKTGMSLDEMTDDNLVTYSIARGDSTLVLFDDSISSSKAYGVDNYWIMQYNLTTMYDSLSRVSGASSCWGLAIPGYIDEQESDVIHQALRYLSPDGDALYEKIMQNETNETLPRKKWIQVGGSQLYVTEYGSRDPGKYHDNGDYFYFYLFR